MNTNPPPPISPFNETSLPGHVVDSAMLLFDDVDDLAEKLSKVPFNSSFRLEGSETELLRNLIDFFNWKTRSWAKAVAGGITWKPVKPSESLIYQIAWQRRMGQPSVGEYEELVTKGLARKEEVIQKAAVEPDDIIITKYWRIKVGG